MIPPILIPLILTPLPQSLILLIILRYIRIAMLGNIGLELGEFGIPRGSTGARAGVAPAGEVEGERLEEGEAGGGEGGGVVVEGFTLGCYPWTELKVERDVGVQ